LQTLAVIALKGGSGKTTLATHLALAAHLRGVDTLLVDVDPQRSADNILGTRSEPGPARLSAAGSKLMAAQFAAQGLKKQLVVIDTPAGFVEDITQAVVLADLSVLVVRPTLIDLSSLAQTLSLVRRLGKPALVVMNQAPPAREGVESPLVNRALRALDYMQAKVSPTIIRSRTVYQLALETGRSAEEMSDPAAKREIAGLWGRVSTALAEAGDRPGVGGTSR
jgi:chromosome partitioning protein